MRHRLHSLVSSLVTVTSVNDKVSVADVNMSDTFTSCNVVVVVQSSLATHRYSSTLVSSFLTMTESVNLSIHPFISSFDTVFYQVTETEIVK